MSFKRTFFFVSIFISMFLFKVISGIPADSVFAYVNKTFPAVNIVNPRGSIWKGTASQLNISTPTGSIKFEEFKWTLNALRLLMGQVSLSVNSKPAQQFIRSDVSVSVFKNVNIEDLTLQLPATILSQVSQLPVKIGGLIKLSSPHIKLKQNTLSELSNKTTVDWTDANVNAGSEVFLGDYTAKLNMLDNDTINVNLRDKDAALKIDGDVELNLSPFKYKANLTLEPTDEFPQETANMLSMVAQKNAQGQFVIKQSN